jgi:hypothetical protein
MKYVLGSLLLAGGLARSVGTANADPLTLTSPRIQTTVRSRSKMPAATSSDRRIASAC